MPQHFNPSTIFSYFLVIPSQGNEDLTIPALQAIEHDTAFSIRGTAKVYSLDFSTFAQRKRSLLGAILCLLIGN